MVCVEALEGEPKQRQVAAFLSVIEDWSKKRPGGNWEEHTLGMELVGLQYMLQSLLRKISTGPFKTRVKQSLACFHRAAFSSRRCATHIGHSKHIAGHGRTAGLEVHRRRESTRTFPRL